MSKAAAVGAGVLGAGGLAALFKSLAVGGAKVGTAAKIGVVGAGVSVSHLDDLARFGMLSDDAGRLVPGLSRSADDIPVPPVVHDADQLNASIPGAPRMKVVDTPLEVVDDGSAQSASTGQSSNEILLVAPKDDAAFGRMFGPEASATRYANVRKELRAFEKIASVTQPEDAAAVTMRVRHSDAEYLTVIGHNDDGVLILPDGSRLPLSELAAECTKAGKQCIVLSCSSRRYIGSTDGVIGVDGELTYDEAAQVALKVQKFLDGPQDRKPIFADLATQLDKVVLDAEGQLANARAMKFAMYPVGGAGVGTGGLMLVEQRE